MKKGALLLFPAQILVSLAVLWWLMPAAAFGLLLVGAMTGLFVTLVAEERTRKRVGGFLGSAMWVLYVPLGAVTPIVAANALLDAKGVDGLAVGSALVVAWVFVYFGLPLLMRKSWQSDSSHEATE